MKSHMYIKNLLYYYFNKYQFLKILEIIILFYH